MGARHSSEPRSVSMDNPSSVIDISDEVVNRIRQGIKKQAKEDTIKVTAPPPPRKEEPTVTQKPVTAPAPLPVRPSVIYSSPSPAITHSSAATITAMDIGRQREIDLQQNDALWRKRLQELERTLNKTNAVLEKEYTAAVEDVRTRFATAAPAHQLPPCQDLKAQVIACYRANPGETLKCSEDVALFRNCISAHRVSRLDAEKIAEKAKPVKGA